MPVIVGAVAGNIDHAADAAETAILEQLRAEFDRAGNRRARRASIRRRRDLADERIRRFRPLDQPPRHDHAPLAIAGPFEIGDGDLAVDALAQGLQEFARSQRLDITLALQRLLVRIHRIGNVDPERELDIDRNAGLFRGRAADRRRTGKGCRNKQGHEQRQRGEKLDPRMHRDSPSRKLAPHIVSTDGGARAR